MTYRATVTPGVVVHLPAIRHALFGHQQELERIRDRLGREMAMAVRMTPQPPVKAAVDAITAAIERIEELKQAFQAEAEPREIWPA